MLTTVAADGVLRSRPLLLERLQPDGSLIFLTHLSSQKVGELASDSRVNVALVGDKGDRYRAWFPNGPDDPDSAICAMARCASPATRPPATSLRAVRIHR
jgi:general stress protein 26